MNTIDTTKDLQKFIKQQTKSIGFIPTMGALHDGHISLIKQARKENDIVVVSIFINPTQFLAGEDLDSYPKKMEADAKICELCNVDVLFTPTNNMMYNNDEVLIKAPILKSYTLEGQRRPEHFDGVLQVVLKLFNLINPTNAYFGKKDAQQLSLIKQMVDNLFLDINIIECDIVREPDGLAMSSRNIYLSKDERKLALNISKSLRIASNSIGSNCLDCNDIIKNIDTLLTTSNIDIEYISIVNRHFEPIDTIELNNTIILIAVKIGTTRLIDNIWI